MPQLHIITTEGQEFIFNLEGDSLTIGRSEDNSIHVPDGSISGHHARFIWNGETYLIEDQGSTNGTRINGVKIEGAARLHPGDAIEFGSVKCSYAPELVPQPEYQEAPAEVYQSRSAAPESPIAIPTPVSKAFGPKKKAKEPLASAAMLLGVSSLVASVLLALVAFTMKAG